LIGLGDDAPLELKKPRKIPIFELGGIFPAKSVIQLACGGTHTLALCNNGVVFSWGNNDDGALGRSGAENTPLRVDGHLNIAATGISAGDTHSIAYNTQLNMIFFWGRYKVSVDLKLKQIPFNFKMVKSGGHSIEFFSNFLSFVNFGSFLPSKIICYTNKQPIFIKMRKSAEY